MVLRRPLEMPVLGAVLTLLAAATTGARGDRCADTEETTGRMTGAVLLAPAAPAALRTERGCCIIIVAKRGSRVPGSTRAGLIRARAREARVFFCGKERGGRRKKTETLFGARAGA